MITADPYWPGDSGPVFVAVESARAARLGGPHGMRDRTGRVAAAAAMRAARASGARDLVEAGRLGRPRMDRAGSEPVGGRLAVLADLVVRPPWPAPVLVAVVHGESATLAPSGVADGVLGRAQGAAERRALTIPPGARS